MTIYYPTKAVQNNTEVTQPLALILAPPLKQPSRLEVDKIDKPRWGWRRGEPKVILFLREIC